MSNFDYIEEANVTMSDNFHSELVSKEQLLVALDAAIEALKTLDHIKKALFYGRMPQGTFFTPLESKIPVNLLCPTSAEDSAKILHGVIGVATESGEMLEAIRNALKGEPFDVVNLFEECGDNQWYIAAVLRVLKVTFLEAHMGNIGKLRKRFPNKFSEFEANNRDTKAERQVLEHGVKSLSALFEDEENRLQAANSR